MDQDFELLNNLYLFLSNLPKYWKGLGAICFLQLAAYLAGYTETVMYQVQKLQHIREQNNELMINQLSLDDVTETEAQHCIPDSIVIHIRTGTTLAFF